MVLHEIDQNLTNQPRNIFTMGLILVSVWFVPIALLLAVIIVALLQWMRIPWVFVVALAFLLSLGMWLTERVTPAVVFLQNQQWRAALFYADIDSLLNLFTWCCSLPAGLLLATVFTGILNGKKGLKREIKRLARGELRITPHDNEKLILKALNKICSSAIENGSLLGVDRQTGEQVTLTDQDANLHTLAIGTTGSGKTTTVCNIIESAICRQLPVFYVDGKGDLTLANQMKSFAERQQRPFYLFSMIGDSVHYNPLASGGITSKKDRIIELREWSEDHYRKIAEGYLQTVFSILHTCGQSIDLMTLAKYLDSGALYDLVRNRHDRTLVEKIEKIEVNRHQISSLIAEIENIAESEIGHLFDCQSGNVLTLQKALEEKAVVYFCLQPLAFPAYAESLGKLIINDLKALAAAQLENQQKQKLFVIFDEFSVFAGEQIIHLINQGRSAGIHAILSTQSLSDIAQKGGDALVGQIVSNCNNFIIQRQNFPQDAEQLANIIGTLDTLQITSQVVIQKGSTGAGSVRKTKEFIVHPDEIKRLKKGEGVMVNKQQFQVRGAWFRKSSIFNDCSRVQ
ncbi:MAG: hypothetical protein A3F17_09275 [Gammaproteobacteria bacterium RIFCSPHIGHO2_12_FULL_41_15]|nr:MAG: hypothetical protein A3F17_09275 [Gammaproteobacteria bacterium RIFCSPHIGHO2_12_FULL_41_15]